MIKCHSPLSVATSHFVVKCVRWEMSLFVRCVRMYTVDMHTHTQRAGIKTGIHQFYAVELLLLRRESDPRYRYVHRLNGVLWSFLETIACLLKQAENQFTPETYVEYLQWCRPFVAPELVDVAGAGASWCCGPARVVLTSVVWSGLQQQVGVGEQNIRSQSISVLGGEGLGVTSLPVWLLTSKGVRL